MTEPLRTCLGCRRVRGKGVLVRLVRDVDGRVVLDRAGTSRGRGAYVCAETVCVDRAVQRRRLTQAFRTSCEASPGLAEEVRGLCQQPK